MWENPKKIELHTLSHEIYVFIYIGGVWIQIILRLCFAFSASFFSFFFTRFALGDNYHCSRIVEALFMYCSQDPHSLYSKKIKIKNGFHNIIHIFKNYFATIFSVFSKISYIQIDPLLIYWLMIWREAIKLIRIILFFFFFLRER